MIGKKTKAVTGALAVLATAALTAGMAGFVSSAAFGAGAPTASKIDMISPAEASAVFQSDKSEFEFSLPAGVVWPEKLPTALREEGVAMEPNVPRAVLSYYWLCAWEDSYLESLKVGDAATAVSSLSMIERFVELPFYREQLVDPEQLWYSSVVGKALEGESVGVETDFATCDFYKATIER